MSLWEAKDNPSEFVVIGLPDQQFPKFSIVFEVFVSCSANADSFRVLHSGISTIIRKKI